MEQSGALLVATSYLFYGQPFGSIEGDLWDYILKRVAFRAPSQEAPADALVKFAINHARSPRLDSIGRITTAGTITRFPLRTNLAFPRAITAGPDGALWFTEHESGGKIGRVSSAGVIIEFAIPTTNSQPLGIVAGPDGALWFTEYAGNKIGRVCLPRNHDVNADCGSGIAVRNTEESAEPHNIIEFAIPTSNSGVTFLTVGPDGAMWFAEEGSRKIGRITTAGAISEFPLPPDASARDVTAGPDGNLWFTDFVGNKIGRITPGGMVSEFPIPTSDSIPWGITAGPDGALWFTEFNGNRIGRITPAGVITEFPLPSDCAPVGTCNPLGITPGPDAALWFTESNSFGNKIGRITTAGVITEFSVPFGTGAQYIVTGPDGALWFTHRDIPASAVLKADGNSLGYSFFATTWMFFLGPHTASLVLGFAVLLGTSVALFLLRFSDDRILAIPVLFLGLTVMLLTPHAVSQLWLDQSPIGGIRFFVIAGIVPALHIIFELFDGTKDRTKGLSYALLGLQFALLLYVATIRMSAMYFVAAIAFTAMLSIASRWRDPWSRRLIANKIALLLTVAVATLVGGTLLTPSAYRQAGLTSEAFWHRTFSALGAHPEWPFGNLSATFVCRPEVPQGLLPDVRDTNGYCAYMSAVKKGAEPGPLYGAQYEKLLRRAFLQVVKEYPRQVLETYLIYKPRLIWNTLSDNAKFEISRQVVPILTALAVQIAILMIMARLPDGETSQLRRIGGAFVIIALFSVPAPLFAYSSIATSTDIICYVYVGVVLALVAALRWRPVRRYVSA